MTQLDQDEIDALYEERCRKETEVWVTKLLHKHGVIMFLGKPMPRWERDGNIFVFGMGSALCGLIIYGILLGVGYVTN